MPRPLNLAAAMLDSIAAAADKSGRTFSDQTAHWLLIGRAIEESAGFDFAKVEAALVAKRENAELTETERIVWNAYVHERLMPEFCFQSSSLQNSRTDTMPTTKRRAAQRRALRWAQADICAGCGAFLPSGKRLPRHHPDTPTFDHVIARSDGGGRTLSNGLLKHQRCNQQRGNKPPTGCDLLWRDLVQARLSMRPRSFKPTFRGGVPNPHSGESAGPRGLMTITEKTT